MAAGKERVSHFLVLYVFVVGILSVAYGVYALATQQPGIVMNALGLVLQCTLVGLSGYVLFARE